MKLVMISVKDRALNAFMRPFFAQTKNQAIRMFTDEINRKDSEMGGHPDDYDLWYLGTWDDETGCIEGTGESHEQLALGKNAKIQGA